MAFSVTETIGGWKHLLRRWQRRIVGTPFDALFKGISKRGLPCRILTSPSQEPAVCDFCGFAILEIALDDKWCLQTCSAIALDDIRDTTNLNRLANGLSSSVMTDYTKPSANIKIAEKLN
jgi:hypothetical protein